MKFEKPIAEIIAARTSCRSYDGTPLSEEHEKKLGAFIEEINAVCGIGARFALVTNSPDCGAPAKLGTYGLISGAVSFIAGICREEEKDFAAFGALFEKIILFAAGLGVQTCWLGGTFSKNDFIRLCGLEDGEYLAVVSPAGYKKQKARLTDSAVRKVLGADSKKPFEELFFDESLASLDVSRAGAYAGPLEAVRLAPSASNKQPWRVVKNSSGWDFYLKRTRGYPSGRFDMQKNDIGIAMCHFELTAREAGLGGGWTKRENPVLPEGLEYISTWTAGKKS